MGSNITPAGLAHALRRHTVNRYTKYAGKSKFDVGVDVDALLAASSNSAARTFLTQLNRLISAAVADRKPLQAIPD